MKALRYKDGRLCAKTTGHKQYLRVGRSQSVEVCITPRRNHVSRTHCIFKFKHGNLFLKDVSTNGCYVNAHQIPKNRWICMDTGDVVSLDEPDVDDFVVDCERTSTSRVLEFGEVDPKIA